ncbi:MAG: DUF4249 family protein [Bacteroidales bacterium]|nr:DUF4249 family protein [Bacteroidales bacterium]
MKKTILYILLALAASACIYPYDADLDTEVPERLVVAGDILIGEQTQIDLGYVMPLGTNPYTERRTPPEASVVVENDLGQAFRGTKVRDGRYIVDTENAPENARYRLMVRLEDNREYITPWSGVNQEPEIRDITYQVNDSQMQLFCSLNGRDSLWNFSWEYDEVWEYHAYFIPDLLYDYQNGEYVVQRKFSDYYFCWNSRSSVEPCLATADGLSENSVVNNNFLNINRSDDRLNYYYSIQLKVRGLSSDARKYMEHMMSLSNGTGDLFTPTPSEMRGNITCVGNPEEQVVGFVSVCKRSFQRIFIHTENIYKCPEYPDGLLFYPQPDEDGNYNLDNLFNYSSPVFYELPEPNATNVRWGPKRCVDCRAWGGTKTRPEWWPNNDV